MIPTTAVVWFTGLPSSGKSTLAALVRDALVAAGIPVLLLDGDEVRGSLVPTPGYGEGERAAFYSTLGNLAALTARQGIVTLVAATANRREYRDAARKVAPRFVEVYVGTPASECARRDSDREYAHARPAHPTQLPTIGTEFEVPLMPDVVAPVGAEPGAVSAVLGALGLAAA
jgi:adenylylsulfate kinase